MRKKSNDTLRIIIQSICIFTFYIWTYKCGIKKSFFYSVWGQTISQWSPFSDCSATCNFGNPIRTRARTCEPNQLCVNVDLVNTTPCNREFPCPGICHLLYKLC